MARQNSSKFPDRTYRIPRKLKKQMIGTGSNKILRCCLNRGCDLNRKYFIQMQTKKK